MNKNELAGAVAEKTGMAKGEAATAVDAVFSVISDTLQGGGDVRVLGFGNFVVQQRAADNSY